MLNVYYFCLFFLNILNTTLKFLQLHRFDNVEESSWFSRTSNTANRLIRQSKCNFNLNVKKFSSNIRKIYQSDKSIEQFARLYKGV